MPFSNSRHVGTTCRFRTLLAVLVIGSACSGGDPAAPVPATSVAAVRVTPVAREIQVGESQLLQVELVDEEGNAIEDRIVSWSTTAATVATVTNEGLVTGMQPGTASIVASSDGRSAMATIIVRGPVVALDILSEGPTSVMAGQRLQLIARTRDVSGAAVSRAVTWHSSRVDVATVSPSGVVTAVAEGLTQIHAQSEGVSAQITLVVEPLDSSVVSIAVTTAIQVMGVGSAHGASATLRDAANNILEDREVFWASTSPARASIDQDGLVQVLAPGSVTISATSESKVGVRQLFGMPVLFPDNPVVISGDPGDQGFIGINVPAGATSLVVTLRGGTGDPGLYVHEPISGLDLPGELCGSQTFDTTIETCIIRNPRAGLWLVEIFAWGRFSNVELKAELQVGGSAGAAAAAVVGTSTPPRQVLQILPGVSTRR